jgi:hypothetical protein
LPRFVPDEVVVRLPSNLSRQTLDDLATRHRLARVESQIVGLTGTAFHRWRITDRRSVSDVIRALEADAAVGAAQPNYRFTLQQNGSPATAEPNEMQYALAKLRLPQAHQYSTGAKVLLAVIDSGVDTSHREIVDAIADSFDAVGSTQPPDVHGTATWSRRRSMRSSSCHRMTAMAKAPKKSRQIDEFRKAACELGCDENEGRFQETLRALAKQKPQPHKPKKRAAR